MFPVAREYQVRLKRDLANSSWSVRLQPNYVVCLKADTPEELRSELVGPAAHLAFGGTRNPTYWRSENCNVLPDLKSISPTIHLTIFLNKHIFFYR